MTSPHVRRLTSRRNRTTARFIDYATRHGVSASALAGVRLPWYEFRSGDLGSAPDGTGQSGDIAEILIFDEIGGSFGVDATDFVQELNAVTASRIRLRINSPGGSVFDALAIANALRHHPAYVSAYVDGLAASAASFVATAADEVTMMPGSQMMIHDASAMSDGNSVDMARMATFLDRQSDNIAGLYALKAGGEVDHWRELMRAETWLYGVEAVDLGLADRTYSDTSARVEARMMRSFDLTPFRYAGREQAPEPAGVRRAVVEVDTAKAQVQIDTLTARIDALGGDMQARSATAPVAGDLASAARDRAAAMGTDGGTRAALPVDTGRARLVPATAQLKARMTERNGQQLYYLDGIASVTDRRYRMWDTFGEYDEIVERSAFAETLAASPDVAFLLNHKGMTMARTQANTLTLSMTERGLRSQAWLNPKRQDVCDLVVAIEDGNITEMSFAFMLEEGVWADDFTTFRITRLSMDRGDVSAVNYGANPYTSIAARSREILADLDQLPPGLARAALARLSARNDVDTASVPPAPALPAPAPRAAEDVDFYLAMLNLA